MYCNGDCEYSAFIILNIWIVHESEILNIFKKQSALDEVVHFVKRKSDFFFIDNIGNSDQRLPFVNPLFWFWLLTVKKQTS